LSAWYALGSKLPLRLKLLSKARFGIKARKELATAAFQRDQSAGYHEKLLGLMRFLARSQYLHARAMRQEREGMAPRQQAGGTFQVETALTS
jgi:hypothetical protein